MNSIVESQAKSNAGVDSELSPHVSAHLLYLMRDELPPLRPDVSVLFGVELPRVGVTSDLIGQVRRAANAHMTAWPAGQMWGCGVSRSGMRADALRPLQDLWGLLRRLNGRHGIIQVRDKIRTGALAWCVARLTGRPFVYWMSYPYAEEYASRFMTIGLSRGWLVWAANALRAVAAKPLFYGWVARRADHLFVQSDAMRSFMVDKGVAPHRMTAVPMAVDVQTLAAVERPVPQPQRLVGRRVIAYLGQLSRYRQSDFLLEVVAELRKNFPDILLLLVGDGASVDEKDWLRRRIDELGVHDCVWLTGWLPQEQALPLVRCAQVGLSPIPRGPLFDVSSPTKAVEYLALSIPCVANDIPDQRFVLESSGGGVCVPMTVRDFVDAVAGLLADPARAAGLGDAGRRWVLEHRSYHHIAQSVAQAYAGLADRRTGATSTRVVF